MLETINRLYNTRRAYLIFSLLIFTLIIGLLVLVAGKTNALFDYGKRIKNSGAFVNDKKYKIEEYAQMRGKIEQLEKDKLDGIDEAEFIKELAELMNETDCELTGFKPGLKQMVGDLSDIEEYMVSASAKGTYRSIQELFYRLAENKNLVLVENFAINEVAGTKRELSLTLSLKVYPFLSTFTAAKPAVYARNPFDRLTAEVSGAKAENKELVLTGIIKTKTKESYAIIKKDYKSYIVKKGDEFADGIYVLEINNSNVMLSEKAVLKIIKIER